MYRFRFMVIAAVALAGFLLLASPCAAQTELIQNGDFEGGFAPAIVRPQGTIELPLGWTLHETFSGSPSETSEILDVDDNGPLQAGAHAVDFYRDDPGASGDWTTIEQILDENVANATSLTLDLDVIVYSHSLAGGGYAGWTEYPLLVRIYYVDGSGVSHVFTWGFFVDPPGTSNSFQNETLVAASTWTSHSFDLLTLLIDPEVITKVRLGGSGHDFASRADNISIQRDGSPPIDELFVRGDANDDGDYNIADAVYSLSALFLPGAPNPTCLDAADANDDEAFNIADPVFTLTALFVPGADSPPEPHPLCGVDPTPGDPDLGCAEYTHCP